MRKEKMELNQKRQRELFYESCKKGLALTPDKCLKKASKGRMIKKITADGTVEFIEDGEVKFNYSIQEYLILKDNYQKRMQKQVKATEEALKYYLDVALCGLCNPTPAIKALKLMHLIELERI